MAALAEATRALWAMRPLATQPGVTQPGATSSREQGASPACTLRATASSARMSYPPACYQFYSPADPINRPVPTGPMLDPNSATLVSQALAAWGQPGQGNFYALGQDLGANDYSHPIYFSQPGDPLYTMRRHDGRRVDRTSRA